MKFLFLLVFVVSCGTSHYSIKDRGSNQSSNQELLDKKNNYLELSHDKINSDMKWGWPDNTGDAFLFTCLYNVGGGESDFTAAISSSGLPKRNPEITPKDSKTPWSKDMEIGLIWCLYNHPDKAVVAQVLKTHIGYGSSHNWDMCGDAPEYKISIIDRVSRCKITGGLRRTLYQLLVSLGEKCNTKCKTEIKNPLNQDFISNVSGFEQHLAILHRYLTAKIVHGLTDSQLNSFRDAVKKEPNNALYQCIYHRFLDGDTSIAANLLLDEGRFPVTRLPSKAEYCTDYLYQRDEKVVRALVADSDGCISYSTPETQEKVRECNLTPQGSYNRQTYNKDWLPCGTEDETRVPIDFLFASACILND